MDEARLRMIDPKHTFQEKSPRGSGVCWKCGQPEEAHWSPPPSGAAYERGVADGAEAERERWEAAIAEIQRGTDSDSAAFWEWWEKEPLRFGHAPSQREIAAEGWEFALRALLRRMGEKEEA